MKHLIYTLLMLLCVTTVSAQRKTDNLDRGLVAVKTATGVFCSWRILAEEYYDVKYNIYRNGTKLNSEPLNVSNYSDAGGSATSTYTVRAVVKGVEQADSKTAKVWATGRVAEGGSQPAEQPNYLSIQMQDVVDRNGNIVFCSCGNHTPAASVAQNYILNDCSVADLDGDGEMEILVKRLNASDANSADAYAHNGEIYSTTNTRAFVIIEAYKLNGQRLWWIDCGPNMVSLNSTEINVVAYDWDEDGKAEVLMRGADNMIIHMADGTSHNVGDMSKNYRSMMSSHTDSQYAWTKDGDEFLLYLNGATAKPYSITEYPLKRVEAGETLASAWAEGNTKQAYGHRSSKYFFGAPVLDGRKASIFLARGIYTQIKMIALDVDPATHALTTRWTWKCNTKGSIWYGQGNHNMNIADVDGDGCDEIVYGSMVIDNNGKGLSSTGLGHGDALHTGDLDPFRKGMETFACNEEKAGNNYRNAATCEIYYRNTAAKDDGRAMAGNFSNKYPGSIAASISSPVISLTTDTGIDDLPNVCFQKPWNPMSLNGIIYWDGDLCAETFDSPGTESEGVVSKLGNRIMQSSGCKLNNDSKNNPCFQGDILGDWREELVLRASDNKSLRILTTTFPTNYRIPSLWFDPEYRQAMVWQMCAYNQPPHPSFFIGEMEGITAAPPALTNTGKTEITVSGNAAATINSSVNGKDLLVVVEPGKSYNKRYAITLDGSVAPASLTVNAPVIVSGNNDNNNITSTAYSCLVSYTNNGTFSGSMRLIKQGEGTLTLPNKTMPYTGQTDIWEGAVTNEKGTISNSKVWMNRHTTLNTTSGTFNGGIEMNYNATFNVTTSATVSNLIMNYGSRVVFNNVSSTSDGTLNTQLKISGTLTVDKKNWQYGPQYLAPVFQIKSASALAVGEYLIGTVANVSGNLEDVIIEGDFASATKQALKISSGKLYLRVYEDGDIKEVTATLVHTGATTCGTDKTVVSYSFDAEKEHFNNEGSQAWQGYAFAQFNFTIPQGKQIKSATLTCTYSSSKGYGSKLYYLNAGQSVNFDAISAGTSGLLRYNGAKTIIADIAGYAGLQDGVDTDVTNAVKAMASAGTIYFQWTANSGGADLYGKASAYAPTLNIVLEDIPLLTEDNNYTTFTEGTYDVILKKTFPQGQWTSLVLPFSATKEQLMEAFPNNAANTEVAVIKEMKDNKVYFVTQPKIDANVPVLIKVGDKTAYDTYTFKGVTVVNSSAPNTEMKNGIQMRGLYKSTAKNEEPIYGDRSHLYFVENSKFYDWSSLVSLPSFSAYIYTEEEYSAAKPLVFMLDGEATGIYSVNGSIKEDGIEYNAVGQRISKSAKGLHIKNGKKYFVK